MLANQQSRVGRISAPAQRLVEQTPVFEAGQEGRDGFTNGGFGGVGYGISGVFGVRPRDRDTLGVGCSVWLVHLEAGEAWTDVNVAYGLRSGFLTWELITDLDDPVPVSVRLVLLYPGPM
jgi:hypothetical protein